MSGRTLASLSYGIASPAQLLEKLKADGKRLGECPHPHDVFNFIITSAVLNEWIRKVHKSEPAVRAFVNALDANAWHLLPESTETWIVNRPRVLKLGTDIRYHVLNILQISWHTANASKHFHWSNTSGVSDIQSGPIVRNWSQYFFTSRQPDVYVEYEGVSYGLDEVRTVLVQFFEGFLLQIGAYNPVREA